MSDYTFLTGVTGLLGRYLLRDLLLQGVRLAVLVRPSRKETARERIEGILQLWEAELGSPLPRPVVLEGDLCQPELGLSPSDSKWIAENCSKAIHSAASLVFHADGSGEPKRSNVEGTRKVLELCSDAGIGEFHYVSTAYVAGLREDLVREDELDKGQAFRNDYEASKLEAEQLVRSYPSIESLTVYRPAVIAGDSQTGYTNTYHGLYMYLKLMSVLVWNTEPGPDGVRDTPVQLNMSGDEPRNIIPVDWTSAVICRLFLDPEAHGHTFHLAPDEPLTPRRIIEAGYKYFNSRGVEFVGAEPQEAPCSDMDRDAHANMGMYREYEESDPTFDLTNLKKFAPNQPCPAIDEEMLHRFWRYGEEDRWGKRKPARPVIPADVEEWLTNIASVESADERSADDPGLEGQRDLDIALDVVGPGGGQWSVRVRGGSLQWLQRGLRANAQRLQLPASVLIGLMNAEPAQVCSELVSQLGDATTTESAHSAS